MIAFLPIDLKQTVSKPGIPAANLLLILINAVVFLVGWKWPVGYGLPPGSILLHGFSHFDLWHLVLNMWVLWLFGNPVNRRLGNGYYLLAYLGAMVSIGLLCWLFCPGQAMGASGAVYAVVTIAIILLPSARIEVAYGALFPITLFIGLISPPGKTWLYWFVRGGTFGLRMYWCLVLIPLLLLVELLSLGLICGIWSWGVGAHLLGVVCGVVILLLLPTRITMPGRVEPAVL